MSWSTSLGLALGAGYVGTDVAMNAVVLATGRDFSADVTFSRVRGWVIAGAVALIAALLLAVTVETAVRVPALAPFPMLGALWVGADLLPILQLVLGRDRVQKVRVVSPLSTFGGFAVLIGLLLVAVERAVSP